MNMLIKDKLIIYKNREYYVSIDSSRARMEIHKYKNNIELLYSYLIPDTNSLLNEIQNVIKMCYDTCFKLEDELNDVINWDGIM